MLPPRVYLRRVISLLAGVAAFGLGVPRSDAKARVRFRTVGGYLVIVPVSVNGQGPYDFLVDTGTNTTLIDMELAAQLNLKAVGRMSLETLTGSEVVPRYFLRSVALGSQSASDVEALGQRMRALQVLDSRIRGVLGSNFLFKFPFLLDYGHHQIDLYDPSEAPDIPGGTRVPIEIAEEKILVSAASKASIRGYWKLALDSGIAKVAVFENGIKCLQDCRPGTDRTMRVLTNLSSLSTTATTLRELTIASHHLRDLPVAVLPTEPGVQRGIEDGLLPTMFFRCVFVNAKESYVIFETR